MRREIILAQQRFFGSHHSYYFFNKAGSNPPMSLLDLRLNFMSDTNTISFTFSKDFQPLIQTAFDDFRQYLKDKAQNELIIEQAKIKASKEKWDAALKTLNRNGTLDILMTQLFNRVMGEPEVSPKPDKPTSKFDENSKSARSSKEVSLISLITEFRSIMYVGDYDRAGRFDTIIIKTSIYNSICVLLELPNKFRNQSQVFEIEALVILNFIKSHMLESDIEPLLDAYNMLTNSERELVRKIVNFEPKESSSSQL